MVDKYQGDMLRGGLNDGFFERSGQDGRKELAYITDVKTNQDTGLVDVVTVDEFGVPGQFLYEPGAERFEGIKNGFAVGDYIETTMSRGRMLDNVRILKLNLNEKQELAKKFKRLGEK